ncbi:MAG: hypothetical protein NTY50_00710, partial [Methylobacter sp.]|nr:hypothetical protein [Methylobacter sp.]
ARSSIYETGFMPKVGHDFLAIRPMINRGFWPFERSESRYKVGLNAMKPNITKFRDGDGFLFSITGC